MGPIDRLVRAGLWTLLAVGAVVLTAERLWLGRDLPLWLDEVWTAMIAGQPTWESFWRQAWLDVNPPLYYVMMKLEGAVAGQSNWALRAPSLVLTLAAAFLPVIWRPPGLSRNAALVWAVLLLLWWPATALALDARSYALLFLIAVAQTIAFARMLDGPNLSRAVLWVGFCALGILTHYYAAYVCLVQGLTYVAIHRRRAVNTWPAALLMIPVAIWGLHHLPRMIEYAQPDVAWYIPLNRSGALDLLTYPFGPRKLAFTCVAVGIPLVGLMIGERAPPSVKDGPDPASRGWTWAALSGLLALTVATAVTVMWPSLTERYLTPMVPAILLCLVLILGRSRATGVFTLALVAVFAALVATPAQMGRRLEGRAFYGWERASDFVAPARPKRLVFFWDHPATKIMDRNSLVQLGGFFFRRDGREVETVTPIVRPGENPNLRLLSQARPHDAVIWIYNRDRKSAARDHPPTLAGTPGWRCDDRRRQAIGVVACVRESDFLR